MKLTGIEILHWRNSLADHPVLAASVEPSWAERLRGRGPSPTLQALLRARVPDLAADAFANGSLGLIAALCQALHRDRYVVPEVYGVLPAGNGFWFSFRDPHHAMIIAADVGNFVAWLTELATGDAEEFDRAIAPLVDRSEAAGLGLTVRSVLAEAGRRRIPWRRLNVVLGVGRLGWGHRQAWQREALVDTEAAIADRLALEKSGSFTVLGEIGLPVGKFALARSVEEAARLAPAVGFPLVAKPNTGGGGTLVFVDLTTATQVSEAAGKILAAGAAVLLQSLIPGDDHRLLVVGGRLLAAARRDAAAVVGDGVHTVEALVGIANTDPARGPRHRRVMTLISLDGEIDRVLAGQQLTRMSVPAAGRRVLLRRTANISTGGTATDFTETIHPDNRALAERAARAIGLKVAGVDFLTPDITRSWRDVGGGICEINSTVGLRPHWLANPAQDVVGPILDLVYPPGDTGRIPVALVTGSNGKTTTTRMLASILTAAGHRVGLTTTDGVQVAGEWLARGDLAGVPGAALVLKEPTVTAAVLETARGGILKRGIYVDECTVAALLNVEHEQVGIDGIDTVADMARLKRKVIDSARDGFVLNANDEHCRAIARELPVEKTILFSLDPAAPFALAHAAAGGRIVVAADDGGDEVVRLIGADGVALDLVRVNEIPATRGGTLRHNVDNALAAAAMALAMGTAPEAIAEGLRAFGASLESSPGRFNLLEQYPVRVLLDYAHNPPALRAAMAALATLPVSGRRVLVVTSPGNRPDDQIRDMGRIAAGHGDLYVCMERIDRRRGRADGEIAQLITEGMTKSGVSPASIHTALTQDDAVRLGVELATGRDDLLAIFYTEFATALEHLERAFEVAGRPALAVAVGG